MDDLGLPPSLKRRRVSQSPPRSWVGSVVQRLRKALYAPEPDEEGAYGFSDEPNEPEAPGEASFVLLNSILDSHAPNRSTVSDSSAREGSFQMSVPGVWPTPAPKQKKRRHSSSRQNPCGESELKTPTGAAIALTESTPSRTSVADSGPSQNLFDVTNATYATAQESFSNKSVDATFETPNESMYTPTRNVVNNYSTSIDQTFLTATEGNTTNEIADDTVRISDHGQNTSELQFYDGSTVGSVQGIDYEELDEGSEEEIDDEELDGDEDDLDLPDEVDESMLAGSEVEDDVDMEDQDMEDEHMDEDDEDLLDESAELDSEYSQEVDLEVEELDPEDISIESDDAEPSIIEPDENENENEEGNANTSTFIDVGEPNEDIEEYSQGSSQDELDEEFDEELDEEFDDDIDEEIDPEIGDAIEVVSNKVEPQYSLHPTQAAPEVVDLIDDSPEAEYEFTNREEYHAVDLPPSDEKNYNFTPEGFLETADEYNVQQLENILSAIEQAGAHVDQPSSSQLDGVNSHHENATDLAQLNVEDPQLEIVEDFVDDLSSNAAFEPSYIEATEENALHDHSMISEYPSAEISSPHTQFGFDISIGPATTPAQPVFTESEEPGESSEQISAEAPHISPEVLHTQEASLETESASTTKDETPGEPKKENDPFDGEEYGLWNLFNVGFTVAPAETPGNYVMDSRDSEAEEKITAREMVDQALFLCSKSSLFGGAAPRPVVSREPRTALTASSTLVAASPVTLNRRDLSKRALELLTKAPLFGGHAPSAPQTPIKEATTPRGRKSQAKTTTPTSTPGDDLNVPRTRRQTQRLAKAEELPENLAKAEELPENPTKTVADASELEGDEGDVSQNDAKQTVPSRKRRNKATPASSRRKSRRRSEQQSPSERRRTLRNGKTLPEPDS